MQALGYRFVGLDEIDDPQLTSPAADTFGLKGQNGRFLHYEDADTATLSWSGGSAGADGSQFVLEQRPRGKVALRTAQGRYLRVDPDADETVRLSEKADVYALFDSIPVSASELMLRSHNGNYLAAENQRGGLLRANAPFMRQAWRMAYVPGTGAHIPPVSLARRLQNFKKAALFVKSKVLQS